jgi:hypothetical protein
VSSTHAHAFEKWKQRDRTSIYFKTGSYQEEISRNTSKVLSVHQLVEAWELRRQ